MKHACFVVVLFAALVAGCGPAPQAAPPTTAPQAAPPSPLPPTVQPTAVPAPPTAAPRSTAEIAAEIEAYINKLDQLKLFSGDLLVAQNGAVIFNKTYGTADHEKKTPITNRTQFYLGDLTEQFTAAAIMLLEQDGKLSVQDPICTHLTNCPDTWKPITIHQLLTQTSGFLSDIDHCSSCKPISPAEMRAALERLPVDPKPAKNVRTYNFANSTLAALIVEQVSGKSYGEFLQDRIFGPLGMADTGYGNTGKQLAVGYISKNSMTGSRFEPTTRLGTDGVYSTAEDLLRWDQALYTDTPLTAASRARIFTPYMSNGDTANPDVAAGYGWFLSKRNEHQFVYYDGYSARDHGFYMGIQNQIAKILSVTS